MRAYLVQADLARAIQRRQADGADARVEFGDARALGNALAHVLDDSLRDVEVALTEGTRRIVHGCSAEALDHALRSAQLLECRPHDGIGVPEVRIEPQTVQIAAEPLADQREALRQRLGGCAVGDDHHLSALRGPLHHHLQIPGDARVCLVGVAAHARLDQGAPHDACHAVDQRMLDPAVRDVNHAVSAELEEPDLRRAQPSADRQTRPQPKAGIQPRDDLHVGQPVRPREFIERAFGGAGDPPLAESRTGRARRQVRTGKQPLELQWIDGGPARAQRRRPAGGTSARPRTLNWVSTFLSQFSAILPALSRSAACRAANSGLLDAALSQPASAGASIPILTSEASSFADRCSGVAGPVARCRSSADRFGAITTAHFAAIRSRSRSAKDGSMRYAVVTSCGVTQLPASMAFHIAEGSKRRPLSRRSATAPNRCGRQSGLASRASTPPTAASEVIACSIRSITAPTSALRMESSIRGAGSPADLRMPANGPNSA